jgi:hypothetical protein
VGHLALGFLLTNYIGQILYELPPGKEAIFPAAFSLLKDIVSVTKDYRLILHILDAQA